MTTILIKHLVRKDPRLGRHVRHDSRSLAFPFKTAGLEIVSVCHKRYIPILNQGNVGKCTCEAAIGLLATDPFFGTLPPLSIIPYQLSDLGSDKLYNDEEVLDGDGTYPPNDVGGSGVSVSTCLLNAKLIAGYQHTFTMDDALKALSITPILIGSNWTQDMFTPDPDGRVHPTGEVAGGHEYLCREVDAPNQRIWCDNSWGLSWGIQGRFYLTFDDFQTLLNQEGDVTIPTPISQPAPQPIMSKKESLLAEFEGWLEKHL